MKTQPVVSEKPLPAEFIQKGWTHKEVWRDEDIRIFERWKPSSPSHHFEVVRIRHNAERTIGGVKLEASESYPSEREWGTNGFSFQELPLAITKAKTLSSHSGGIHHIEPP